MTIFCLTLKDIIFNNSGGEHLSKQRMIYGERKQMWFLEFTYETKASLCP